jgi:hypothetical protein
LLFHVVWRSRHGSPVYLAQQSRVSNGIRIGL